MQMSERAQEKTKERQEIKKKKEEEKDYLLLCIS